MKKKKIIAALGLAILIMLSFKLMNRHKELPEYITTKEDRITLKDVESSMKTDFTDENAKGYFSKDVVNPYTLKYLKFLQMKFKNFSFQDHLDEIRSYLFSVMSSDEAEQLFALYKKFVEYEKEMSAILGKMDGIKSAEDAIERLYKIREYQRKYFGKEVADALFGVELKSKEYPIRRSAIVNNDELYGAEKEERLKKLNEDMWGDDAGAVENIPKPYSRYKEQLRMYSKDMSEMDGLAKAEKVREIRSQIFSPEVVQRLEAVDTQMEKEKVTKDRYYAREQSIVSDADLSDEEKAEKVHELQNEMFGESADAFRRRENIRKGIPSTTK